MIYIHWTQYYLVVYLTFADGSKKRPAIEMFAEPLNPPLPDAIKDINQTDYYKPQDDIVDNWTVLVEKDEKKFCV